MRRKVVSIVLSLIFSLFIIIGLSFTYYNNLDLIFEKAILSLILFIIFSFILYIIISFIFKRLDSYSPKDNYESKKIGNKLINLFNEKPILFSLLVIILAWLIYVIAFYPAILSPDPSYQILQYFGIDNKYSYYSILLDNNMIITNHHPVMHTLLLGSCVKIGLIFNSTNIGLFIYSIVQITILALTLSYTIFFMKKMNINIKYRIICLILYAIVPVFPFYAMSPVKDVIFGCLIILYIIMIFKYINNIEKFSFIKTILLLILITLSRNNGIHVIILSLPFLLFIKNKNRLKLLLVTLSIFAFNFSYNNVILPYFKVTPSSKREMLSIPFQQTARYVKYYDNEIKEEEKKIIDKILTYDTLASRYDPEKSDPVKNEFNKYSTNEDLKSYFKVWYDGLLKHPRVYIEATLNNTYGYFYPPKTNWYIYYKYNSVLKENNFNYHYNDLSSLRNILVISGKNFPGIPIIGLFVSIGLNTWILLFMISYLIYKKKYKQILYFLPSIILLLVCVASPVNTYFRYALPNIFAMPILLAIFIKIIQEKEGVLYEK